MLLKKYILLFPVLTMLIQTVQCAMIDPAGDNSRMTTISMEMSQLGNPVPLQKKPSFRYAKTRHLMNLPEQTCHTADFNLAVFHEKIDATKKKFDDAMPVYLNNPESLSIELAIALWYLLADISNLFHDIIEEYSYIWVKHQKEEALSALHACQKTLSLYKIVYENYLMVCSSLYNTNSNSIVLQNTDNEIFPAQNQLTINRYFHCSRTKEFMIKPMLTLLGKFSNLLTNQQKEAFESNANALFEDLTRKFEDLFQDSLEFKNNNMPS